MVFLECILWQLLRTCYARGIHRRKSQTSFKNWSSGFPQWASKAYQEDVLTIRQLWKEGKTRQEIYELYPQVTTTSVRDIINNKTWKHLL